MNAPAGLEATLGRVSLRMASTLDLDDVLGEITRGLVRDLDAAMARIWLVRPAPKLASAGVGPGPNGGPLGGEGRALYLVASAGLSERLDGSRSRVPIGSFKIGEIAQTRSPVCTNDLLSDPRFSDKSWIRDNELGTFAGYPLTFDDELLGVLAMFAKRHLTAVEFEQLGIFAAQASVAIKNAELFAEVSELSRRLEAENAYLKEELHEAGPAGIVGQSAGITRVLEEVERVATTTSTVLLQGETGTGKELFARALHEMSPRRDRALVKVNCAALTPTLIESELFGHEKGAFTGAMQRRLGRFELAQGGTLFLDEIGELPLEAQAKLLRVLQEHEVERVGGSQSIQVDARIVAATNRDLAADVRAQRFRADLFFRLSVFPIRIPPLRERRDDVPLLVSALLQNLATRIGCAPKGVEDDAMLYLQAYDWPGNVRELQNVLERALILARGKRIGITDLPELASAPEPPRPVGPENAPTAPTDGAGSGATSSTISAASTGASLPAPLPGATSSTDTDALPLKERVDAYERNLIAEALRLSEGNQSEAARRLQTNRATLQYKMKTYGL